MESFNGGEVARVAHLVSTDATSGYPWVTGLVTVVVAGALGVTVDVSNFLPGWADPLNLTLTAVAFLVPIAAGTAAAHSSQVGRGGLTTLAVTTPRGPRAVFAVCLVSVLLWHLAAYAVLLFFILSRSNLAGAFSWPMLLLPLSAVTYLTLATALGTWLGSRFHAWLAAPLLSLTLFIIVYAGSYLPPGWDRLSPIYPATFYQYYFQPNTTLVWAQILGALTITCISIASSLGKPRTWLIASLVVGFAAILAGANATSSPVSFRAPPSNAACKVRQGVALCLWPEARGQLNQALNALVLVHQAGGSILHTPNAYKQAGLPKQPGIVVPLPAPGEDDYVFRAVLAASPTPQCQSPSPGALEAAGRLQGWLQARVDPSSITDEELTQLIKEPASQQAAWVRDRLDDVQSC